jgi:hypothetical protein
MIALVIIAGLAAIVASYALGGTIARRMVARRRKLSRDLCDQRAYGDVPHLPFRAVHNGDQ